MARKYQRMLELLPEIKGMMAKGMTQKRLETALGLTENRPIHKLLTRDQKSSLMISFASTTPAHPVENRRGAAYTAPLRLKLYICYHLVLLIYPLLRQA